MTNFESNTSQKDNNVSANEHDYDKVFSKRNNVIHFISNNPFRILGLPAGSSLETITNSYKNLKKIVYSGAPYIPFVTDNVPPLTPIERTLKMLDDAYEKLQNDLGRLIYSCFWIYTCTESQKKTLSFVCNGDFEAASNAYIEDYEETGSTQNFCLTFLLSGSHDIFLDDLLFVIVEKDDDYIIQEASRLIGDNFALEADAIRREMVRTLFCLYDKNDLIFYIKTNWKSDMDTILGYVKEDNEKELFAEFFNPEFIKDHSIKKCELENHLSRQNNNQEELKDPNLSPELKRWREFALQYYPALPRFTQMLVDSPVIIDNDRLYLPLMNEVQKKWITDMHIDSLQKKYRDFIGNPSVKVIPILSKEIEDIKKQISEREKWLSKQQMPKEYRIGGVFPDPRLTGEDEIRPEITHNSFNLIISLKNITEDEINSILDDEFSVSYLPIQSIPNLAFEFSNGFRCDVALNAMKINIENREEWLESEDKTVLLFLIDAGSRILKGIRFFDIPFMKQLKQECRKQNKYTAEAIEEGIKVLRSKLDVIGIISNAIRTEIIPPVENIL